jgi:transposase
MEVPQINTECPTCKILLKIVEQQQAQIKLLEQRLEKVEREGKRQAAPFRKNPKTNPKKPGRKSDEDHGKHQRRAVPRESTRPTKSLCRHVALTAGTMD